MTFGKSKTISCALLLLGLAIGTAGVFMFEKGTSEYVLTEVLLLVLFAAGVLVAYFFGRCPNCGRHLIYRLMKHKNCPYCGKKLDPNGKYVKPRTL